MRKASSNVCSIFILTFRSCLCTSICILHYHVADEIYNDDFVSSENFTSQLSSCELVAICKTKKQYCYYTLQLYWHKLLSVFDYLINLLTWIINLLTRSTNKICLTVEVHQKYGVIQTEFKENFGPGGIIMRILKNQVCRKTTTLPAYLPTRNTRQVVLLSEKA